MNPQEDTPAAHAAHNGDSRKWLPDLATPFLLLLTPFAIFVFYHGYDVLSPEIWRLTGLLLAIGLAVGTLVATTRGPLRAVILGVMIMTSVDLMTKELSVLTLLMILVAATVIARILQKHITSVVSVMALAMIVSTALLPDRLDVYSMTQSGSIGTASDKSLPPVIHFILDEYGGVEGLPPELEFSAALASEIESLFTTNGFRLNGGAYSQYFNTYNSIGNTLNFTSLDMDAGVFDEIHEPYHLKKNAHFQLLAERGYQFRIYQSSYLDYCQTPGIPVNSCMTYNVNSIKYIETLAIPAGQKAAYIGHSFTRMSALRSMLRKSYNTHRDQRPVLANWLPYWNTKLTNPGPLPVLPVLDQIADDIIDGNGGEVFFAHLLLPHSTYLLDDDCKIQLDIDQWQARRILEYQADQPNTHESRIKTYHAYARQLRCTNRLLEAFFTRLREAGRFDDAIIVMHGDHGARINRNWPIVENRDKLVDSDFIDGFPTLFAARTPAVEPGYTRERAILPALLAEAMGVPELAPDGDGLYLFNGLGKEMQHGRMPSAWMDGQVNRLVRRASAGDAAGTPGESVIVQD